MQHLKRKNIENKVNSKKKQDNKPKYLNVSSKNNKPIKQKIPSKININNSSKVLPKDNKLILHKNLNNNLESSKVLVKNNQPKKSSVNINKSIQKIPENNHSNNQVSNNHSNFNELKSNLNTIKNNLSSDNGNILTGKLTANEIFIKNNDKYINIKEYINSINTYNKNNTNLTNNENITTKNINVLNDSTFNGKITVKNNNKKIELNPEKSSILCENGFIKNVDENNNNSAINIKYLKQYINNSINETYYAYLIKDTDIYSINYNDGDYILHYYPKNQFKFILKQIRINDNNIKEVVECKNIKEGSICITYDTEINMFVYVNTNEVLDWKQFINNSIDNLIINKSLTLNNNKINNILTGDKNNDIIPTIGYIENNYIKNTDELTLNKLNLPVKVPDNKRNIKNSETISINYITATNIDEKNQSIPTVDYINYNYAKKSDIPDLSNCLKKSDIPIIIAKNDTLTKSSDKNIYSSNKIDSLLNNTMQKISNLKITFNVNWKDTIERECEYSLSNVSGTIITLNRIINDKDIFEENLINIPSLEINLDEIKDIENNTILNGNNVNIFIKEISVLSSDNSVSATYYISKNKPTTITIKDNDNNTYRTEFVSIIVENNKGQLIFNNNKAYKLYHKTITINMDNIYVCNKMIDKI